MHRSVHRSLSVAVLALAAVALAACGAEGDPRDLGPDLTAPSDSSRPPATTGTFTFDGSPSAPLPFNEAGWDVQLTSRDRDTWRAPQPLDAHHGMDCGAFPATHRVTAWEELVYRCRNHIMTSLRADGYGAVVLTPDRLLALDQGEAVVRFALSTLSRSSRDWVGVWLTPWDDQLAVPASHSAPDLNSVPANGLFVEMTSTGGFCASVIREFEITPLPCEGWRALAEVIPPSATVRTAFEIRVSRDRVRVGMPELDLWFVDAPLDRPLPMTEALVQFAHYSYTPLKCSGCAAPNSWHWDDVRLAPSRPFTVLRASPRLFVDAGGTITLPAPAPVGAHLRFVSRGRAVEFSTNGGATWRAAAQQRVSRDSDPVAQYWAPVPAGTRVIQLRPAARLSWWPNHDQWVISDPAVFAR